MITASSAEGPLLARLVCHALNRGDVLEGPLTDRIAGAGTPGARGQVAIHCGRSSEARRGRDGRISSDVGGRAASCSEPGA
jgi:hypothetical protein